MILVDTSVWIDFFNRAHSPEAQLMARLIDSRGPVCVTEIIVMEILQGIRDDMVWHHSRASLLSYPRISPRGIETYLEASQIYRLCQKRGARVGSPVDCLIAAIAIENGVSLFHKDADYRKIADHTFLKEYKSD